MKLILIKDVKSTGKKNDIVEVKDGYAKFLINNKSAVPYSTKSLNVLNKEITDRTLEEEKLIDECNKKKKNLENLEVIFNVKTGKNGKVFGSISSKQISEELKKLGFEIDKKKIIINNDLNSLGLHRVDIILHKKVVSSLKVRLSGGSNG